MKHLYSVLVTLLLFFSSFAQNSIVTENAQPGNPIAEWGVPNFRDTRIAGFSTKMSLNAGQTVHFKISVEGAATYTLKIYRIGYYAGNGARLIQDLNVSTGIPLFNGVAQPAGISDPATGSLDCSNWSESASWTIPSTAVSGFYIAKIERTGGGSNHIAFIVRNDASNSDLYFQLPDATWQAYNGYGGNSIYDGNTAFPNGHAVKVSYNRPFFPYNSLFNTDGREADWYMNAVYPMIRWLESNGYNITYTSCNDVDKNGARLLNHKIFLSVGHDEYWSKNQRANVEAARDAGVHLAFFSGNEVYWKTRWESNDGSEDRTLVCYKEGLLADGSNAERVCGTKCDASSTEWTGLWRMGANYDAGKPENGLTGQISWIEFPSEIGVPASYQKLRFWRNTTIPALLPGQEATLGVGTLGYEWDYEQSLFAGSNPAGRITMSSKTENDRTHKLSLYRHNSGALVFGAGTVQWAWGLDGNHLGGTTTISPEMQQATVNLFADMNAQPATLQPGLVGATKTTDVTAPVSTVLIPANGSSSSVGSTITISGTAADAGGGVVAAVEVSTDAGVTWRSATINAADQSIGWSYRWVPLAEGTATIKVRGVDDSGNIEIPGQSTKVTIGPDVCPCNIFPPASLPSKPLDNDHQPIEIGVKFKATENGFISGIRYYKGTGTTGTHIGNLWSTAGVSLATATFTSETESGWQEVLFSNPVAITAGVTYVASCFSPSGDYASTPAYFTQAVVNGPLRGLADGEDGSNGLFSYSPTSVFPTNEFKSINYWVDVVFTRTNGGIPPDITKQPAIQTLCEGATASFTSEAVGSPSPTVQWQSSTDGTTWADIAGAVNTTLSFAATVADNNKLYRAVWTNLEGSVYSTPALLTVTSTQAPVVTVQDNCGNSVLSVGSINGSFLWSNGATTSSITVTTGGNYTVVETVNGCSSDAGSGTASPKTSPVLTSSLTGSVKSGDPLSYTATSSETGTVFTWSRAVVSGISNPAATGSGNISETLTNTTNSPVNVVYEYTLELNGCSVKENVVITVNPLQGSGSTCVITTSIKNSFNSRSIQAGRFIWFNSSFTASGIDRHGKKDPVTIYVSNSRITYSVFGRKYSLAVPDSRIRFADDITSASTRFVNNVWETSVPLSFKDDVFMGGLSYLVPVRFPRSTRDITWTADVSIDKKGVSLEWKWAAAVYSKFAGHDGLAVKPISGWRDNPYRNFDEAGTPENYKAFLAPGSSNHRHRRNYTGNYSKHEKISCGDNNDDDDNDHHGHGRPPFKWLPKPFSTLPFLSHRLDTTAKLDVAASPNPSRNYFSVKVDSKSNEPITVRVLDNFGKEMEKHERVSSVGILRLGDKLKTGLYFIEVIQGGERKTITVLKIN
ncbi:MAG: N,N-dimethylformamidase beta subunit family domain-containing protein [Chitinophagaceae bacterium]